tara:strand:- start:89 stop:904 length:816 start_codon:yes stop_codon:yes gene_type:complete
VLENLFINGCSFLEVYDVDRARAPAGHCLAEKLKLNPIGYAASARGNDRIIATTKLFFYDNPELIKDTFVLIGWSSVVRQDYLKTSARLLNHSPKEGFDPDKSPIGRPSGPLKYNGSLVGWGAFNWVYPWRNTEDSSEEKQKKEKEWFAFLNGGERHKCFKVVDYDISRTCRLKYLEQVLSLQDFFKLNSINYCMYNALPPLIPYGHTEGLDGLADKVDKQRFFQFDGESHMDYVEKEMLTLSETDGHPNPLGSKLWADKLYSFIKENELL